MSQRSSIRVNATGTVDKATIRQETFNGREYTVVPVVALVEGLLQGLTASEPEFASAEEFGRFPEGWNGRPVVMNHPQVNGTLVSANSPDILEKWAFGFTFNTQLDDTKLKTEAWIDNARAEELGGEFLSTLERLTSEDSEDLVEVSTGLFTEVVKQRGTFNAQPYKVAWSNVVPDHLAMLSEGSIGACSVEGGCGAPRLNTIKSHEAAPTATETRLTVQNAPAVIGAASTTAGHACCDSCAKGEGCMAKTPKESMGEEGASNELPNNDSSSKSGSEVSGGASSKEGTAAEETKNPGKGVEGSADELTPELVTQQAAELEGAAATLGHLATNSIAPGVTFDNAREIVQNALRTKLSRRVYIAAITSDVVAYYSYSYDEYDYSASSTMGISYSLAEDGSVTFTGDPYPVNLVITIVPQGAVTVNAGNQGGVSNPSDAINNRKENEMAENTGREQIPGAENQEVSANAGQAPVTLQSYLENAPLEVQEILNSGIKMHNARKDTLVKQLAAHASGAFTEDQLKNKNLEELEQLATLAGTVKSFEGVAVGAGRTQQGINANATDTNTPPPAPRAFEFGGRKASNQDDKGADGARAAA